MVCEGIRGVKQKKALGDWEGEKDGRMALGEEDILAKRQRAM